MLYLCFCDRLASDAISGCVERSWKWAELILPYFNKWNSKVLAFLKPNTFHCSWKHSYYVQMHVFSCINFGICFICFVGERRRSFTKCSNERWNANFFEDLNKRCISGKNPPVLHSLFQYRLWKYFSKLITIFGDLHFWFGLPHDALIVLKKSHSVFTKCFVEKFSFRHVGKVTIKVAWIT